MVAQKGDTALMNISRLLLVTGRYRYGMTLHDTACTWNVPFSATCYDAIRETSSRMPRDVYPNAATREATPHNTCIPGPEKHMVNTEHNNTQYNNKFQTSRAQGPMGKQAVAMTRDLHSRCHQLPLILRLAGVRRGLRRSTSSPIRQGQLLVH